MSGSRFARLEEIAAQLSLKGRLDLAKAQRALHHHDAVTAAFNTLEQRENVSTSDPTAMKALAAFKTAAATRRRLRAAQRAALLYEAQEARELATRALGRERAIGILRKREEEKARAARERREEQSLLPRQ